MEGSGSTQLAATFLPPCHASRNCCSPISIWQLPSAVGVGVAAAAAALSLLASGRWPSNNVYNLFIRLLRTTTQKHREQQLAGVGVRVERGTGQRTGAHKKLRQRQRGIQVHVLSYMVCMDVQAHIYTNSYMYVAGCKGEGKFSGQEGGFNPLSATAA